MFTEEDKTKMDKAAEEAAEELKPIIAQYPDAAEAVGNWMKKWTPTAGLKRLGRLLSTQGD